MAAKSGEAVRAVPPPLPEKARTDWPPVVVAGAYQTAVVLMRNLARRGLRVCCFDCVSHFPGFKTVYGRGHHCPNPDLEPAAWLEFMTGLARSMECRPVLMATADQFVSAIDRHGDELEKDFIFARPKAGVQGILATKKRQYDVAALHGLAVPRTRFVRSLEELTDFASTARFPCLLKPDHFRDWQRFAPGHPLHYEKVAVAANAAELADKYRLAAPVTPELMVQEVIQGPDTAKIVYLSCYGASGERIASCLFRELRTCPIYFGSASVVEPVSDPEADAACDAFLRGIGWQGLCEIELKRDMRDSRLQMIEANPRFSLTADAAGYAGVDLGWIHYLDLIGKPVGPVYPDGRQFRHIALFRDFESYRDYLREGLATWGDLIRSYRRPVAFLDFDLHDWRVTLGNLKGLAKLLLRPWYRRIFPRRVPAA